ncbi:Projectin/twitchin [Trachipleistophora hominis]|uniref:Projectin/twitchin n=1 Tax=Trachipleistophora hominis TaxID=72359 RepID=L7JR48_TRAHO|nr:Projectin/twitchin [Trachipleistophora hominis]
MHHTLKMNGVLLKMLIVPLMSTGLTIRTLLSKGVLKGSYDDETISNINKELRSMNYQAIQNCTKTLLVLKDLDPPAFDNSLILNNLENYIVNREQLESSTLDWLTSMDWYADGEFTDVFLIQNEEYLLEKFSEIFHKCKFCGLVVKGTDKHTYCLSLYKKHLGNASLRDELI